MDPATRRLAIVAVSLGAALIVVVGGWTLLGHRSTAVPVIQADSGPVRVKPENPGGMQVAGANEDILSGAGGANAGKLAPPPETPAPQDLRTPPAPAPLAAAPAPVPAAVAAKPAAEKPVAVAGDKKPAVQPAAGRSTLVQLAAVRSEEAAKVEWQRLSHRMPDLFGQHRPAFSKVDRDGTTLWRVRTGGFDDTAQASAFCEKVRAKGSGCSVAEF
jgi:hypothetical protein